MEAWALTSGMVVAIALAATALAYARRSRRRAAEIDSQVLAEERPPAEASSSEAIVRLLTEILKGGDPQAKLDRFAALLRTLLAADAVLVFALDDTRRGFALLGASGDGPAARPPALFYLGDPYAAGLEVLSLEYGGLLSDYLREGFAVRRAFVLRVPSAGSAVAALAVGYRDGARELEPRERVIFSAAAPISGLLVDGFDCRRRISSLCRANAGLIRTVSQALSGPLHVILGDSALLRETAMPPIYASRLERMKEATVQLAEHVEATITAAHLESAGISARETTLGVFLAELEASVPGYWLKQGVTIDWPGDAPYRVVTDADRLKFVLRQIVRNALSFTREGRVTVSLSLAPGNLLFSVADTGSGMPGEMRRGIAAFFESGDGGGAGPSAAIGLGLHLACRLLKDLSGELSVESEPGKGTTVHVVVPVPEPDGVVATPPDHVAGTRSP